MAHLFICCPRKPNVGPCARDGGPPPPGGGPPPPGGPLPPMPEDPPIAARPAWRNVQPPAPPKLSKRQKRQQKEAEEGAAGPSGAPADARTIASWATWQRELEYFILSRQCRISLPARTPANPQFAPTPPVQEAELVAPERPAGLFGPRSPRESYMKPS
jgi:hypothetical protein